MRAATIAVAIALLPAGAAAQSGALESARQARDTAQAADAATQRQADAAQGPADAAAPAAEAPAPVEGAAAVPAAGAVAPPDRYTVKPGDTLWDLSGRFLNNPWYWPKVWSYNPEITNPHWIYPGNAIRFFPGAEEAPARVEPVPAVAGAEGPEEELTPPKELEDFSKADMKKGQDYGDEDAVAVAGPYKIGYVAPKGTLARRDTFMTEREVKEAGVIRGAFEDKELLTVQDRIYAAFQDPASVKIGQTYTLFRTTRPVDHPVTRARIGYQTTIVGDAKAVAQDGKITTLVVTRAIDAIERGDHVGGPAEKPVKMIARRPNARRLDGRVVSSVVPATWLSGEHHLVFVDLGRSDGVEEGNTFTVTRAGDPYGQPLDVDNLSIPEDRRFPSEDIGELLVVDARAHFSTALVVKSLRELFAGDRVVMRAAAAGTGSN